MDKILMKGNEALGEAAIRAGCRYFFGYPITPQNELPAYMAKKLLLVDGVYLQAESEVSAINMVYGAAGTGVRVMTSSSSPGISLKQEGISYIAGADLPCVIVNIVRCSPGLGGIQPAQSDYFQAVKGGGHGDYHMVVLAPSTVQEVVDLTTEAFDIADAYRIPTMILGDGMLGQMMEPVAFTKKQKRQLPEKTWAITGTHNKRDCNLINSLYIQSDVLEKQIRDRYEKYEIIKEKETMAEVVNCENAEIIVVAYGTTSRIIKSVIEIAEEEGLNIGLIRPITLWPFPSEIINSWAKKEHIKAVLAVEMSTGQMVEDVRLAVNGLKNVEFYGRTGGVVPEPREIIDKLHEMKSEA